MALCLDGGTVLLLGLLPPAAGGELWSALAAVLGNAAVRKAFFGLEQAMSSLLHGAKALVKGPTPEGDHAAL